jgi:hypothetical protein
VKQNGFLNRKIATFLSILIIVPVGFYSKFYEGPAANWVNDSLAGSFYEIFWCLIIFQFFNRIKPFTIAAIVLLGTSILEFLQLWHALFLEYLRSLFIGQVVLGTSFTWSDFLYHIIGCGIGWWWMRQLQKFDDSRDPINSGKN